MKNSRRKFIKNTLLTSAAITLGADKALASKPAIKKNALPKWKGFNFLDFFNPDPSEARPQTSEDFFKWMQDWGFDFVRIPIAYPSYLDFDRSRNIKIDEVRNFKTEETDKIEHLVYMAQKYGHHVSLNLHRAPGYCINAGFHEPYNIWNDQQAEDDFCYHWRFWAKRFASQSSKRMSFDLLNEPSWRDDMNDQFGAKTALPGDVYYKLVAAAKEAIHAVNDKRLIIADGNQVGNKVTPELIDLKVGQSCRGYAPGQISHYKAPWVYEDTSNLPEVKWPGQVGDKYLDKTLLEELYAPWIELKNKGIGVHCGECGCFNKTPHHVFLAWFADVLGILSTNDIGFALWEMSGSFGLLNSEREDVAYEDWYGHKLDRKLLTLLQKA
ncbi:MAG: endoglucanase [Algoriphagus sp.]|jgi:endoglucanase